MNTPDLSRDAMVASANASPPVAVAAAHFILGVSLNDWVLVLTIVYLAAQLGYLGWRWWRDLVNARTPPEPVRRPGRAAPRSRKR